MTTPAGRGCPSADLLHERQQIADSPVVRDFTVLHTHHVHCFEVNFAMRRSNSEERALVRAVIDFAHFREPITT